MCCVQLNKANELNLSERIEIKNDGWHEENHQLHKIDGRFEYEICSDSDPNKFENIVIGQRNQLANNSTLMDTFHIKSSQFPWNDDDDDVDDDD